MAFPTLAAARDELSSLQQLAPGSTVTLLTVDGEHGALTVDQVVGPAAGRLRDLSIDVGYQVSGWVAANLVPMVNADAQLDLDVRADELRYALAMPLLHEHRLMGVLTVYSADPFTDTLLQRVELLMPQLAAWLDRSDETPTQSFVGDMRFLSTLNVS
jgi:hypothetical protein